VAERSPRRGLRVEVIGQLGALMTLALVVLVGLLAWSHDRALQQVIGRALLAEARSGDALSARLDPQTSWWTVARDGSVSARGPVAGPLDPRTYDLAQRAFEADGAVVDAGAPWEPMRFAVPIDAAGRVALARLPAHVSLERRAWPLAVAGLFVLATFALFAFVATQLLRRRVVEPLEQLAAATRELAGGEGAVSVSIDGPRELGELAGAFNEMSAALAARSKSLEAAVVELREANELYRRTRAGLERAERLAVVGRLAAGVAHEVGNPMGAVLAFVELAAKDASLSDTARSHLAKAGAAGERVRRILGQLLDFSRPARPTHAPFDLAEAVREAAELATTQRRGRALRIEVDAQPDAPPALGDAAVSVQILLNLLLNAADATRERDAARVRVWVRAAAARRRAGDAAEALAPGLRADAVECVVSDNGCGIAEEDRERIFDPFFTTKGPGEGTGLGLATAQRLAEEMNGALELATPPTGDATAFRLLLPAASARATTAVRRAE
jgi:signal transduction histidine kinase